MYPLDELYADDVKQVVSANMLIIVNINYEVVKSTSILIILL